MKLIIPSKLSALSVPSIQPRPAMIKPMHQLLLNRDIYAEVMLKRLPEEQQAELMAWVDSLYLGEEYGN